MRLLPGKLLVLLIVPLLLASSPSATMIQEEPAAEAPDRRGLPYPYCFGQFCRLERDEWIVGGEGHIIHFSSYAPKREQSLTKEDLSAVYFVNPSVGWIVGTHGTIFHTTDGGQRWRPQRSGVKKELKAITCVDENHCWAVGFGETVLRTEDGGQEWKQIGTGGSEVFYAVDFISEQVGWVAGENGIVLRTLNGGKTWDKQQVNMLIFAGSHFEERSDILAVKFTNENLGWVAGRRGLARTTDGGLTWKVKVKDETFIGLISPDGNKVWAINEDGPNYCSEDGGDAWQKCSRAPSKN